MSRTDDGEKVSIVLPKKLLERIEDYRSRKRRKYGRIPSRSRVITVLLEKALSICEEDCLETSLPKNREVTTL